MRSNAYRSDIRLGEKYRDTVSGYEGTATAIYFFLHGCERVVLEQLNITHGEVKELAFDAPRLMHIKSGEVARTDRTGGVRPAPGAKRGPA